MPHRIELRQVEWCLANRPNQSGFDGGRIGNCSSSQTGDSAVSVELVEHLSVLPYLLSRSRCPRSAPNGKHRTFHIKQNQQLQCRCSELEEQCRMARSQATKTNLGAISSGILEITKEVVERHLNENQEIRMLLAQPQGKVGNFIKNNPDMFQKFATRQNAVRKSPNTISESTMVDTLSSDHGANSSSSDDLQGSPLSSSAQQRMDISSHRSESSSTISELSEAVIIPSKLSPSTDTASSPIYDGRYPSVPVRLIVSPTMRPQRQQAWYVPLMSEPEPPEEHTA